EGEPALLSFDDARTLFHEFGHALHGLLSDVTYPMIAGTNVASDFVELPSALRALARAAGDPAPLRPPLPYRRAHARRSARSPDRLAHLRPGLHDDRVSRIGVRRSRFPCRRARRGCRRWRRRDGDPRPDGHARRNRDASPPTALSAR